MRNVSETRDAYGKLLQTCYVAGSIRGSKTPFDIYTEQNCVFVWEHLLSLLNATEKFRDMRGGDTYPQGSLECMADASNWRETVKESKIANTTFQLLVSYLRERFTAKMTTPDARGGGLCCFKCRVCTGGGRRIGVAGALHYTKFKCTAAATNNAHARGLAALCQLEFAAPCAAGIASCNAAACSALAVCRAAGCVAQWELHFVSYLNC